MDELLEAAKALDRYWYDANGWKGYAWFNDHIVQLAYNLRLAIQKVEAAKRGE